MNKINEINKIVADFKMNLNKGLHEIAVNLRDKIHSGDEVTLLSMKGEPQMQRGLKGVVRFIDDAAQIHVVWENGSTLAINVFEDRYVVK